ncbi:response regulator receiver protein [Desulfarculus baarsii DSM 2075]|uniref:Response regulator receiver protein n=1 Tax=Desulfarculus baarsii (strain ATCC 33931 / DSM 2075 / LMG 7858 / VKM B-1802 / 2st14) TaxID=644282 RepID=E1QI65_DESB2|nr:response regulator [Desulfarculus baarsii]ADK85382.1 response regulator receiver protein [Desulfarculus baarsii DSM 2075]
MKHRILVVDDSLTIRNLLSMVLRQNGHDVVTAGDGFEGLQQLAAHRVDLIISDLNMPRMDGLSFIKKIRQNDSTSAIPVILLSTEKASRDIDNAMDAGASKYLVKPVLPAVLAAEVKKLLR